MVHAPFEVEFSKRPNAKLQVVYVRACRIRRCFHRTADGNYKDGPVTLRDWTEQILVWKPFKGVR